MCLAKEKKEEDELRRLEQLANKPKKQIIKYRLIQHKEKKKPMPANEGLIQDEPEPVIERPPTPEESVEELVLPTVIDQKKDATNVLMFRDPNQQEQKEDTESSEESEESEEEPEEKKPSTRKEKPPSSKRSKAPSKKSTPREQSPPPDREATQSNLIESFDRESSVKSDDEEEKEDPPSQRTNKTKKTEKTEKNAEIDSDTESDMSDLLEKNEDNMIQGMIQTRVQAAQNKADAEGIPATPFTEHLSAFASQDGGSPKPQMATSQNFTAAGS